MLLLPSPNSVSAPGPRQSLWHPGRRSSRCMKACDQRKASAWSADMVKRWSRDGQAMVKRWSGRWRAVDLQALGDCGRALCANA
eukprot:3168778-Prymnesium_polylepis.1